MNSVTKPDFSQRMLIMRIRMRTTLQPFLELFYGIKTRTIPWESCTGVFVAVSLLLIFRGDVWLFRKAHLTMLYPRHPYLYWPYFGLLAFSGFLFWAGTQTMKRRKLLKGLTDAFICAGLKNRMGKLPAFIYEKPLDPFTRKLKVTNAKLPLSEFKKAKDAIESGLDAYVDEIKEERGEGTIEIVYSHYKMDDVYPLEMPDKIGPMRFIIGHTRARRITSDYEKNPHLLVAGQTNSGKSTILRQLITTAYLNNDSFSFTLIDLKEGLEFQLFENLPRVNVVSNLSAAVAKLRKFETLLEKRLKLLKVNKCKDLSAYLKFPAEKRKTVFENGQTIPLNRHLIVIDEAADLFLAGGGAASGDIQKARRVLIEIARKGRAAGFHLIFATQRPDAKSIDSQIKANLPGIICFQMPNDASSIIVLGNGRATDLPPVPGRAIWKTGSDMVEVQTPYLSPEEAEGLLKPYRTEKPDEDQNPPTSDSDPTLPTIETVSDDATYDRA
jgi:FtsK/SpoIIIE family